MLTNEELYQCERDLDRLFKSRRLYGIGAAILFVISFFLAGIGYIIHNKAFTIMGIIVFGIFIVVLIVRAIVHNRKMKYLMRLMRDTEKQMTVESLYSHQDDNNRY